MPRKVTRKLQRELKPDRKYSSVLIQRLINKSMLDGKKLTAERAVYTALEQATKKLEQDALVRQVLGQAIDRLRDLDGEQTAPSSASNLGAAQTPTSRESSKA